MKKEKLIAEKEKEFARKFVLYWNGSLAYRETCGKGKNLKDTTCRTEACKLLAKESVQKEIERICRETEEADMMDIRYKRRFLKQVVDTPIGKVNSDSNLCQEYSISPGEYGDSIKIKMPSKLAAIELDNRMAGHDKPTDSVDKDETPSLADHPGVEKALKTLSDVWESED